GPGSALSGPYGRVTRDGPGSHRAATSHGYGSAGGVVREPAPEPGRGRRAGLGEAGPELEPHGHALLIGGDTPVGGEQADEVDATPGGEVGGGPARAALGGERDPRRVRRGLHGHRVLRAGAAGDRVA